MIDDLFMFTMARLTLDDLLNDSTTVLMLTKFVKLGCHSLAKEFTATIFIIIVIFSLIMTAQQINQLLDDMISVLILDELNDRAVLELGHQQLPLV